MYYSITVCSIKYYNLRINKFDFDFDFYIGFINSVDYDMSYGFL